MSLAGLVVTAVKVQGRPKAAVARDHRVSRRWVHELVGRFEAEGEAGLVPRSRRPRASPQRTPEDLEDEIVELRKHLAEQGLDAGAHTIAFHLNRRHGHSPAPSTIWRILSRRGFVPPSRRNGPAAPSSASRRTAQRTLAGRHHALEGRRREGRRDPERDRRPLAVARGEPREGDHQGGGRGRDIPPSRCGARAPGLDAHRHSSWVVPFRCLDRPAGGTRIRGTGTRPPPLLDRPERAATPCLLITGWAGPPPGRRCVLLGTR